MFPFAWRFHLITVVTVIVTTVASIDKVAEAQSSTLEPIATSTLATDGQAGWIGSLDYLHWSVRSAGVEYGITDVGGVQDRGAVGNVLSLGGNYDSGFRFGIGRRMGNGPELLFQYTDFDSSLTEFRPGSIRSTFISSDNGENNDTDDSVNDVTPDDRATAVTASKSFDYQVFDFELAQTLTLTKSLSLRLSGGGRATNVDQGFSARYTGGDFQVPYNAFKTSGYRGGGMMAGGDLIWYLLPSLSLTSGINMGMMLGRVNTRVFLLFP